MGVSQQRTPGEVFTLSQAQAIHRYGSSRTRTVTGLQAAIGSLSDAAVTLQRVLEPRPAGFPPGPAGDAALDLLRNPLDFLTRAVAAYGGIVGLSLGGQRVVLLTDLRVAHEVLIDKASIFVKEGTAFFPGSSLAGNGLLVSDGELWRRQRQLSNPAFRRAAVEAYAEAMGMATQQMLRNSWLQSRQRDIYADFNALTLQITTDALFGADLPPRQALEVTGAIETAFRFFASRTGNVLALPEWVPTPDNLQYSAAVARLDAAVYKIIANRRNLLASSQQTTACLLDKLLTSQDEAGQGMADQALRDELMTLLIAGQETSAILLSWACAFLAHHPDIQQRAAEEVQQVLQGRLPTSSNIRGLRLMEAVVLEVLRLRPPAYLVGRCAAEPTILGSYPIAAGTTVLVSAYIMHRDAQHWPRATNFVPDRWLEVIDGRPGGYMGLMSGMGHNGAYFPFGAGPRNCIGTGFAMMETLLILASILQKFQLLPVPGARFPKPDARITLRPADVKLRVQPR
ncbi:hypothetical protein WJX72_005691 [[Myrmecia] bisecta]|uniref:Cytochrome P450 n=1 Tax=[Myrmecia] bisecta TaxID=41462 RepID=A0AAW1R6G1_9CHLO